MNDFSPKRLVALAKEIREVNAANGWRPFDIDDPLLVDEKVPSILCLIHSEITEAYHGYDNGDLENFSEELADVCIRILDFVGGYRDSGAEFSFAAQEHLASHPVQFQYISPPDTMAELLCMHSDVSETLESYRKSKHKLVQQTLALLWVRTYRLSILMNFDLGAAIKAKVEKNKSRGYRHGNKLV